MRSLRGVGAVTLLLVVAACQDSSAPAGEREGKATPTRSVRTSELPVVIEVFAPEADHFAGVNGVGWFVDLALEFEGDLASTGFTGNQLTGPGVHDNAQPMPGVFAPGKDDRFGGLVVLFTTTTLGARSCQNLANLFNLTGPTNVEDDETEIWDTWIISQPSFGVHTASTMYVAEVADLNHDGIHNDAPDVVPDVNHDGKCRAADVRALGLDSELSETHFNIN